MMEVTTRHRKKRPFTRRQRSKARRRAELEARAVAKAEKREAKRDARRMDRLAGPFEGMDGRWFE